MKTMPVIPMPALKNCPCVSDTQGHCVFPFIESICIIPQQSFQSYPQESLV